MMRKMLLLPLLLLFLLTGCNTTPIELSGLKRVAILTPEDSTNHPPLGLGSAIKDELLASIPRQFAVEVIDGAAIEAELPPGQTSAALLDPAKLADLGRRHGIDAFVAGAITIYEENRGGRLDILTDGANGARLGVKLGVRLAFNVRLVRASDGTSLFYRQARGESTHSLVLDPGRPLVTLNNLLEPHFVELREEAVRNAVRKLIGDVAREHR